MLEVDLEATPLQVKADSMTGSEEHIKIWMVNKEDASFVAGILIKYSDPITFSVAGCGTTYTQFPKQLPSDQHKIWTFSKTELGMKIEVNGIEVLDYHYTESQCGASWKRLKELNIHYIKFDNVHSEAVDFYRLKHGRNLLVLSSLFRHNISMRHHTHLHLSIAKPIMQPCVHTSSHFLL